MTSSAAGQYAAHIHRRLNSSTVTELRIHCLQSKSLSSLLLLLRPRLRESTSAASPTSGRKRIPSISAAAAAACPIRRSSARPSRRRLTFGGLFLVSSSSHRVSDWLRWADSPRFIGSLFSRLSISTVCSPFPEAGRDLQADNVLTAVP